MGCPGLVTQLSSLIAKGSKFTIKSGQHCPGAPLTYFNDGGRGPRDFFGSEILTQSDFFGSMKDARIFLSCKIKKKQRDFFGLRKKD